MITFENISKAFGKLQVLNGINLRFNRGEAVAIVGPNGSGKTTLLKILLGMVLPDEGSLLMNDEDVSKTSDYRSQIGYMPQISKFPSNLRISQLFDMMKEIRQPNDQYDLNLYEAFELEAIQDKYLSSLSGGTKQKVAAALAFYFNPPVLVLDEPTAGLDPLACEILKNKIRLENTKGKLLLITSHILSDLEELTERLVYLQDGRVHIDRSITDLKADYGQNNLSRVMAILMKKKEMTSSDILQMA